MAVSIDAVYQKVLALANKEQRGYITPQEFNLFADQAQKEILEQYFYDINQFGRLQGNNTEYSDMIGLLNEKLSILEHQKIAFGGVVNYQSFVPPVYRIGSVIAESSGIEIEEVSNNEYYYIKSSSLTKPSSTNPVYVIAENGLNIYPTDINKVIVSYIKEPTKPVWGYIVVGDKAIYSSGDTSDFELHSLEESELVYRILAFAGITLEKPQLTQMASGLEGAKIQQQKR